jgi:hypothetical protein
VGSRAGLDKVRKISPLPGFDPRTVHPVAQSLYRLSYPTHPNFKNTSMRSIKRNIAVKFSRSTKNGFEIHISTVLDNPAVPGCFNALRTGIFSSIFITNH